MSAVRRRPTRRTAARRGSRIPAADGEPPRAGI